jgi:superfamily II DNA/RNA helicase
MQPWTSLSNKSTSRRYVTNIYSSPTKTTVTPDDPDTVLRHFANQPTIHETLKFNLQQMNLFIMTDIQAATWNDMIEGCDIIARSSFGTGKTISYLLPTLQRLMTIQRGFLLCQSNRNIDVLILAPTRELAISIGETVEALTSVSSVTHQVIFGGNSRHGLEKMSFHQNLPNILVSTPGRLVEHLKNTKVHEYPFERCFSRLHILIMDEADR